MQLFGKPLQLIADVRKGPAELGTVVAENVSMSPHNVMLGRPAGFRFVVFQTFLHLVKAEKAICFSLKTYSIIDFTQFCKLRFNFIGQRVEERALPMNIHLGIVSSLC